MPNPHPRKRRWTREKIVATLELIGELTYLSPLPPSPPASRESSPAPSTNGKRKLDDASDLEPIKRPRTSQAKDAPRQPPPPAHRPPVSDTPTLSETNLQPRPPSIPAPPLPPASRPNATATTVRSEPCEDGEVPEETPFIPEPSKLFDRPIRRPRKGKPSKDRLSALHEHHHLAGRTLKYSGTARLNSLYPPSSPNYKPLSDPPPPGSNYHRHGVIISRLEIIDALLHFVYAKWADSYKTGIVNYFQWSSIRGYLDWCLKECAIVDTTCEEERMLFGLVSMVEGFVRSKCMNATLKYAVAPPVEKAQESLTKNIALAASAASAADSSVPVKTNGKAPPMLPSPASTSSTPVTNDDGTPNTDSSAARPQLPAPQAPARPHQYRGSVPVEQLPSMYRENPGSIPPHVLERMEAVMEPLTANVIGELKKTVDDYLASAKAMEAAYLHCNLPAMRRCFPKTWARMVYSTLGTNDEIEVDMDDDEGELCWPEQTMNGSGIAWVCFMGKAMVTEYGTRFGYKSLAGVIPKPGIVPEDHTSAEMEQRRRQQLGSASGSVHNGPPPSSTSHHGPPPGYSSSGRDSGNQSYGHHRSGSSSHGSGSNQGHRPYPPHGAGGGSNNHGGNHHGYNGYGQGHRQSYSSSYGGIPPR